MISQTDASPADTESQPIALYLDIEDGATADLEIVSQAAIEFVKALREVARELSPDLEIRVGLRNGEEGSLSLNSLIKFLDPRKVTRKQVLALTAVASMWCGEHILEWTYEKMLDHASELVGDKSKDEDAPKAFSHQEIHELAEEIVAIQKSPDVQKHVAGLYRALDKDTAIRGVGIKFNHHRSRPTQVVPREEFRGRVLDAKESEITTRERTVSTNETVRLISPILDPTSRRKWLITTSEGTVSASMDDRDFVERLRNGQIRTTLQSDLRLEIELTEQEEFRDGEWHTRSRSITRVRRIIRSSAVEELSPTEGENRDTEESNSDGAG